jgi:hypothetical protein
MMNTTEQEILVPIRKLTKEQYLDFLFGREGNSARLEALNISHPEPCDCGTTYCRGWKMEANT